jgi:hypothetical protein
VQNAGIIRQNDETTKNLLQLGLTYDIMIMGGGGESKNPLAQNQKKRGKKKC